MIALLGFIALHLVLIALGMITLRVAGLLETPDGRATALWPAVGPALVTGVALLMPWLVVALVLGIPLTFATAVLTALLIAVALLGAGWLLGVAPMPATRTSGHTASVRAVAAARLQSVPGRVALVAAAFVAWGLIALADAPTRGDDARIWSLKALTLTYYDRLQPEIFLNPLQAGAHPVYPLLQPALEAVLSRAMGRPVLGFFHAELWLLLAASAWTAAFLIWRRPATRPSSWTGAIWLSAVALLAVIPALVGNVILGDADTTGSVLLALGVLCVGLWIDTGERGYVAIAAVMLTAAASTKDEDTLGAVLVIAVAFGLVACGLAVRTRRWSVRAHLLPIILATAYFAALVLPWRLWLSAHHLSDPPGNAVQPPIPQALNPLYFLDRHARLYETATAMISQVMQEWDWLAALFIVACGACIVTGTARRVALFYLTTFAALILSLLWLYTTTPLSLAFLLPTSMNRTISVFMAMTPLAIAHLWSTLQSSPAVTRGDQATTQHAAPVTL
jgi:hypothetical protein